MSFFVPFISNENTCIKGILYTCKGGNSKLCVPFWKGIYPKKKEFAPGKQILSF